MAGEYWIGVALNQSRISSVVFDSTFESLAVSRAEIEPEDHVGEPLSPLIRTIRESVEKAELSMREIGGIGVGSAGVIDMKHGAIVGSPRRGAGDVNLTAELSREFGVPIKVANDADARIYGEYRFGLARKKKLRPAHCVVGVFIGQYIDGGCVYDGEILSGETRSTMGIGHICVARNGPLCGCGQRGCLEAVASGGAIANECRQAAERGDAPNLKRVTGAGSAPIRGIEIAQAIAAGDRVIEQIVHAAVANIGRALGSVINLLSPDVVIVGGGIMEAMPDQVGVMEKAAQRHCLPSLAKSFRIVVAETGVNEIERGAATWAAHLLVENAEI